MSTLNNGNPNQTSTDYVVANPDFIKEKTSKVLAQTTPSESQPGVAAGAVEIGAMSVPYGYYDGAGQWRETTSNHTFQNSVASRISLPTVSNVGARFAR